MPLRRLFGAGAFEIHLRYCCQPSASLLASDRKDGVSDSAFASVAYSLAQLMFLLSCMCFAQRVLCGNTTVQGLYFKGTTSQCKVVLFTYKSAPYI